MVGYFVLLGAVGLLLGMSAGVTLPKDCKVEKWKVPFYKSAYFLCGACRLNDGKTVEKLADALLILVLGLGITLAAESLWTGTKVLSEEQYLSRPQSGDGDQILELQAEVEGMTECWPMEVVVSERQYTQEEKNRFLEQALEELNLVILGENSTADEVRTPVCLPTELAEGKVSVQWTRELLSEAETDLSVDEVLDSEGKICEDIPEDGVILQLRGSLSCEDLEAVYERALHLYPPLRTPQEQLQYELQKKVEEVNAGTIEEASLSLPVELNGKQVRWQEADHSVMGLCLMFTLIAAAVAYFGKEQEFQKQQMLRRRQLIMDYPGLLFQLSMLLEAGLTIQNAFGRIVLEYREQRKRSHFVYEEMLVSYYEMQSGVSEVKAYEHFGRRCGMPCYIKLGTMLSGGVQKGAQGLPELLRKEAVTAMDERRQLAKKLGEEAGTKLLLPMILMLLVVLIILMVPAAMAF